MMRVSLHSSAKPAKIDHIMSEENHRKIAHVTTAVNIGFDGQLITVECNITKGLPAFTIVGLADKAVGESRERVRAALVNSGFDFPARHITVNLAPADIVKTGSHFDLAIALSILVASGQLLQKHVDGKLFVGELSLGGDLRPLHGALGFAETAIREKLNTIFIPRENAAQAALLSKASVVGITTLSSVVLMLLGENEISTTPTPNLSTLVKINESSDKIDEIRGQEFAKRALVIAAAGHHNILFSGTPGAGKTMLARSLPGLLPPLTAREILETTKIHSLAGETDDIITTRPFRAPHNTASTAAIAGGGVNANPGEISLAHNGVLFMDEIPEFSRSALELLRQPLEDHTISISRANTKTTYPANFMLVATMNPCPCGYLGDPDHECTCSQQQIYNYQSKLSGPLLDRIDMQVTVAKVARDKMFAKNPEPPQAAKFRHAIAEARVKQMNRQGKPNANLSNKELSKFAPLDDNSQKLLDAATEKLNLSARSHFKIIRIARTIADLAGRDNIEQNDIAEALQFRG